MYMRISSMKVVILTVLWFGSVHCALVHNSKTEKKNDVLVYADYAAQDCNEKMVKYLIEHGADTNAKDDDGQTPLFNIPKGGENLVEVLFQSGANASVTNKNGSSILDRAIENGDERLVDILLKNGAFYVGVQTFFGAITSDRKSFVEKLIQNGFGVNATDEKGQTALHIAAMDGSEKVIDLLLQQGIDINATDSSGANALHRAAVYDESKIAKFLIVKGININGRDKDGQTPLHFGVENGAENVMEVLLLNNAKLHVPDNKGYTPLTHANRTGTIDKFSNVLKKLNKEIDSKEDSICALIEAISGGTDEQVNHLLYNKVSNVNVVCLDLNGDTPLIKAAEVGRPYIVDNLINRGAKVNLANPSGVTPLFPAVTNGNEGIVRTLISCGANLSLRDKYGCTALMRAAEFNYEDIALLLLENGASKYDTDSSDKTAAMWANDKGYFELGNLIKNWKPKSSN